MSDLQGFAAFDPAHENLHALIVAGKIRNALVVRGNPGAAVVHRPGGQRAGVLAIDIDAPQVGAAAILHDVHEVMRIDHKRAVGADLRIAGPGKREHVFGCENRLGGVKTRGRQQQYQGNTWFQVREKRQRGQFTALPRQGFLWYVHVRCFRTDLAR